jgi:hypothetical protein
VEHFSEEIDLENDIGSISLIGTGSENELKFMSRNRDDETTGFRRVLIFQNSVIMSILGERSVSRD